MMRSAAIAAMFLAATPALANDSIAEVGAGGVILARTDAISMESEDLRISMDAVSVDYVFRNQTDKDVETVVAFPMPDIAASPYTMPALPDNASDNFLDFEVTVGGRKVEPKLDQRAVAVGIDVTAELQANGIPVNPFTDPAFEALKKLPQTVADAWIDRGLILIDSYDDGSGWKDVRTPLWTLKSTYWWTSKFPAKQDVKVAHRYRPSLGASVGVSFFSEGKFQGTYSDYKHRFCMDDSIERAVRKAAKDNADGYPQLSEFRVQYVLTTGGNWALGTIGKFHLTIDKGDARNIVSFCGSNVKKTGPTTFEMSQEQFYPERDIDLLILAPPEASRGDAVAEPERKRQPGEGAARP